MADTFSADEVTLEFERMERYYIWWGFPDGETKQTGNAHGYATLGDAEKDRQRSVRAALDCGDHGERFWIMKATGMVASTILT